MSKIDVSLLRDEAQRLLKEEINLLKEISNTTYLLTDGLDNSAQTFDSDSIAKTVERLEDEVHKLDNLELVLAVVGTMKAGKSTTINAIVGMEVLPNRNRPMTALPTLIRHTQGVTEPRLIFQNTAPIDLLVKKLSRGINNAPKNLLKELSDNDDMRKLLEQIDKKRPFSMHHEGSEAIFNFLKSLNDLVRLATELNVEFPFEAYSRIENLPIIEVEFTHLKEMGHMQGRLTLLDTPGPNEAGQVHLRPMLHDQLRKASAVLAVLDYTQLKSDADNEMRENLEEVAKVTNERLYTLVNRFDQKDRNSDSSDEVRKYVANTLMKGLIPMDRVYPVSAKCGYLASRAKHELALNNCLPDHDTHEWVGDFAKMGIGGRRWESKLNDLEEITEAANYLWDESQFNEPLEQVIRQAYAKAAIFAIDSSASKMVELAENIKNFLGTRKQAFKKSVEELQSQIDSLQENIAFIQSQQQAVSKDTEYALDEVKRDIQSAGQAAKEKTMAIIEQYFQEGKRIEAKNHEVTKIHYDKQSQKKSDERLSDSRSFIGKLNDLFVNTNSEEKTHDFEFSDKPLRFEDERKAKDLLQRIEDSIEVASKEAEISLHNDVQQKVQSFNEKFQVYVDDAKKIIDSIQHDMKDFKLIIHLPDVRDLQLGFAITEVLDEAARIEKESKWRYRRKNNAWGAVCSWFDTDDWGWESYSVDVDVYYIDMKSIKAKVEEAVGVSFSQLEQTLGLTVEARLNEQANSFFNVLRERVEHIRGDLIASIDDRKKSQNEQELLLSSLEQLEKPLPNLLGDSEAVLQDVRKMIADAGTKR